MAPRFARPVLYALLCAVFIGLGSLPLPAQPAPDEAALQQANTLYAKMQYATAVPQYQQWLARFPGSKLCDLALYRLGHCFQETGQPAKAVETLDAMRRAHPASTYLPSATVLLYTAAQTAGDEGRASAVWMEIFNRWPQTDYAWQAIEASYRFQAQADPEHALAWLEDIVQTEWAPPDARARVLPLRLAYLKAHQPAKYLAEVEAALAGITKATTPAELALPAQLAPEVYGQYLDAGRLDDVFMLHLVLTAACLRCAAPQARQAAERALDAVLAKVPPERMVAAILPHLAGLAAEETPDQAVPLIELTARVYAPLLAAKREDEAKAYHAGAAAAGVRTGAAWSDRQAEYQAYLGALSRARSPQYVDEVLATVQSLDPAVPEAAAYAAQLASGLYTTLFTQERADEAKRLHERMRAALAAAQLAEKAEDDEEAYGLARLKLLERRQPAQFLKEALPIINEITTAKSAREMKAPAQLAGTAYRYLVQQRRLDEAERLHATVQKALVAAGVRDLALRDSAAFNDTWLDALERADPGRFMKEATAAVESAGQATTLVEMKPLVDLTGRLYPRCLAAGRWEEAARLHGILHDAFTRIGAGESMERTDYILYFKALTDGVCTLWLNPATTPQQQAAARAQYLALWPVDCLADFVLTAMQAQLMRSPSAPEWTDPFANFVAALPAEHPKHTAALLLLAQCCQLQAQDQLLRGQDAAARWQQAEAVYRRLLDEYPALPQARQVWTGLLNLYQARPQPAGVEALLARVAARKDSVEALDWLANYHARQETTEAAAKAEPLLRQLLAVEPRHAQALSWQMQLAHALELQQNLTAARAVYQSVIDRYPDTFAAATARRKLDGLKGGQ